MFQRDMTVSLRCKGKTFADVNSSTEKQIFWQLFRLMVEAYKFQLVLQTLNIGGRKNMDNEHIWVVVQTVASTATHNWRAEHLSFLQEINLTPIINDICSDISFSRLLAERGYTCMTEKERKTYF